MEMAFKLPFKVVFFAPIARFVDPLIRRNDRKCKKHDSNDVSVGISMRRTPELWKLNNKKTCWPIENDQHSA